MHKNRKKGVKLHKCKILYKNYIRGIKTAKKLHKTAYSVIKVLKLSMNDA